MTHRELVQKAREAGLTQTTKVSWRNEMGQEIGWEQLDDVKQCCELGLIAWGKYKGYLTHFQFDYLYTQLTIAAKKRGVSVVYLNDLEGFTWEQFTELLEAPV